LIGNTLVGFSVRQYARPESISKRPLKRWLATKLEILYGGIAAKLRQELVQFDTSPAAL